MINPLDVIRLFGRSMMRHRIITTTVAALIAAVAIYFVIPPEPKFVEPLRMMETFSVTEDTWRSALEATGVDRDKMTDVQLKARVKVLLMAQAFPLLSRLKAADALDRLTPELLEIFRNAAEKWKIPVHRLLAHAFVENFFQAEGCSGAKACGMFQFIQSAGQDVGLVGVREERAMVEVKVNNRVVGKRMGVKQVPYDNRGKPEEAVPAGAHKISYERDAYFAGDQDMGSASFHSGMKNLLKFSIHYLDDEDPKWRPESLRSLSPEELAMRDIKVKREERIVGPALKARGLSFYEMLFRSTPTSHSQACWFINGLKDFSDSYLPRIQAAEILMKMVVKINNDGYLYLDQAGKMKYMQLVDESRKDTGQIATRRYWSRTWGYAGQESPYKDRFDLFVAKWMWRLKRVPEQGEGYSLRLKGSSPIGECDLKHQTSYLYLRPETLGMLQQIGKNVAKADPGGKPLSMTGLMRTDNYYVLCQQKQQGKDDDDDPTEVRGPIMVQKSTRLRLHNFGLAFDIGARVDEGRSVKPANTLRAELWTLRDLEFACALSYAPEMGARHVVIAPFKVVRDHFKALSE